MINPNAWFCLRSHPKHEHIAAAQLRRWDDVEVFCPRIRFRRKTKAGTTWVTEALFPGYLFARFEPETYFCRVRSAQGISGIVHFGGKYPLVANETVEEMRREMGPDELATITPSLEPGMEATIAEGPFNGLRCVIHQVLPARQRVEVLLNLLGQITLVELREGGLLVSPAHPLAEVL